MTDRLESLRRERLGYIVRNLPDRVRQVDEEIARITGEPATPAPIETAADDTPVETAVRRPGRPRKTV